MIGPALALLVWAGGFHGVGKMKHSKFPHQRVGLRNRHTRADHGQSSWLTRFLFANSILGGLLALLWLILRTGSKPSRLAYPCQQAALSAATLALGVMVVSAIIGARRRLARALRTPAGVAVAAALLLSAAGAWAHFGGVGPASSRSRDGAIRSPRGNYRAQVFHVADCPVSPIGDRFVGLDNLLTLMGREGTKFYRSATQSVLSGPDGIIAVDDVVVIKINYQWAERGGTNTDLLRGLVRRLLDHPDAFAGEIVICENSQFAGTAGFDRAENNAQDHTLSPRDVVDAFQLAGHPVSLHDWTSHRSVSVGEYSGGDMSDGYIVYAHDGQLNGKISYPKFQTDQGTYISLRDGIWDVDAGTYDSQRLKFINVPVLKAHRYKYGVTACVKNNMGVLTTALSTNSHNATANGMMGALLGEIGPADLNILDCIWVSAGPTAGPDTFYGTATRRDELVASVDPVAADIWSTVNILIPTFLSNGYTPPWPWPSADPDDPTSEFREYLDNAMDYLLGAGYSVTNDLTQIDLHTWNGAGDSDGDSDVDLADHVAFAGCLAGPNEAVAPGCEGFDLDGDNDVDTLDFRTFVSLFTGPGWSR